MGKRRPSTHSENKEWKGTPTQTSIRHRTGQEKLRVEINKSTTQTGAVKDTKIEHTSPQVGEAAGAHRINKEKHDTNRSCSGYKN